MNKVKVLLAVVGVFLLAVAVMGVYRAVPANPVTEYVVYVSGQQTKGMNYEFRVNGFQHNADGTITLMDYYERVAGRWVQGKDLVTVSGYVLRQRVMRTE